MTEPGQHLINALDPRPLCKLWPRDHDHGKTELACRIDFRAGAIAARIARDQPFDAALAHQRKIAYEREGTARHDHLGARQRQRAIRRVDEAQRIGMLRLLGERREVLAADGEEDARTHVGQGGNGRRDILNLDPAIAVSFRPWRPFQREQRHAGGRTGDGGVAAHLGGKRMRRIDDMRDLSFADEVGETLGAAKAANARRQRMRKRNLRPSRIGIDRVDSFARERCGKCVGVACSAQDEGARHV